MKSQSNPNPVRVSNFSSLLCAITIVPEGLLTRVYGLLGNQDHLGHLVDHHNLGLTVWEFRMTLVKLTLLLWILPLFPLNGRTPAGQAGGWQPQSGPAGLSLILSQPQLLEAGASYWRTCSGLLTPSCLAAIAVILIPWLESSVMVSFDAILSTSAFMISSFLFLLGLVVISLISLFQTLKLTD